MTKELTISDIPRILIFQDLIHDHLRTYEKCFYFKKTKGFLTSHFSNGCKAIGVFNNEKLLGQAFIVFPNTNNRDTGMTDMKDEPSIQSLSVIQGLSAHPDARGYRIGKRLIEAWKDISIENHRYNIVAETAQDNHYSWKLFRDCHVPIVSTGIDPDDGTLLYNHHANLKIEA